MTGIERLREWANELREVARAYRDREIDYVPIDVEACQRKNAAKLDAIADQIERETERETERTCRDKNGGQKSMGFECTRCETQCEHIYNMCTGEIDLPTYCPGCGAKVVME